MRLRQRLARWWQRSQRSRAASQPPHEFLLAGDFDGALEAAEAVLRSRNANGLGSLVKTIALVKLGKFNSAIHFASKAWKPERRGSAELAYVAAYAAAESGLLADASMWLLRAVDHDPGFLEEARSNPVFRRLRLRSGQAPAPDGTGVDASESSAYR